MKMCRLAFKYKWSNDQILDLTWEEFNMYLVGLDILEAEDVLVQMRLHDHPHSKKESRAKFYKQIQKIATPRVPSTKTMTTEELYAHLGGLLNG